MSKHYSLVALPLLMILLAMASWGCANGQSAPEPSDVGIDSQNTTDGVNAADGNCIPQCTDKFCGPDGCGGTCPDTCDGICNPDTGACSSDTPCDPDCTNKACGDDGCGGECPDLCEGVCNEETGTCDDEQTPVNGCTSELDQHIYEFQNVNQSALTCMAESDKNPAEATTCLANETGLSAECQECWSGFFHCVFQECATQCTSDPTDIDCSQCHQSDCMPAFEDCAGQAMNWQ